VVPARPASYPVPRLYVGWVIQAGVSSVTSTCPLDRGAFRTQSSVQTVRPPYTSCHRASSNTPTGGRAVEADRDIRRHRGPVLSGVAQTVTYLLQMVLFHRGAVLLIDWRLAGAPCSPRRDFCWRPGSSPVGSRSLPGEAPPGGGPDLSGGGKLRQQRARPAYDPRGPGRQAFSRAEPAAFSAQMIATRCKPCFVP